MTGTDAITPADIAVIREAAAQYAVFANEADRRKSSASNGDELRAKATSLRRVARILEQQS